MNPSGGSYAKKISIEIIKIMPIIAALTTGVTITFSNDSSLPVLLLSDRV